MRALTDPRLLVPPLPPLYVGRPRLVSQLGATPDPPLILLSAGPGAGKTVLLSDWARQHHGAVAWMTVTAAENEPSRFWPLFLSAVRARRASAEDLPPSVMGEGATGLLESLFVGVPASTAPLVLVIDEAHVLTHPHILDGLDSIVRGWHPQLRLVLAARSDPLLPLHRYRLGGSMRELRAADLAMTAEEAQQLLAAHGVTLSSDAFDLLSRRTEGWVAGMRLSALRMAGAEHPADFVVELALDPGSIGEYLIDEVLARQPPTIRQLLIQTGFLDEVSGPLADAVTCTEGSAQTLVELARSNSFVVPLDHAQTRFRYHRLFAEVLRHLQRQQAPGMVALLQCRAATWFAAQGDVHRALRSAAAAGDGLLVAALLAQGGLAQMFVDRRDLPEAPALLTLLDQTTTDAAHAAELRTARLAVAAVLAGPGDAFPAVAAEPSVDDPELALTVHLAHLIRAEKAGDGRTADAMAGRLLDGADQRWLRAVPGLRAAVLLARARARFWDGQPNDVEGLLDQARQAAVSDGTPGVELVVLGMIALVNAYGSRPARADEATRQALELQRSDMNLSPPLTLDLAAALRAFVEGDFGAVARALRRAAGASGTEWEPAAVVLLAITRAQAFLACGQFSEARLLLHALPMSGGGPLTLAACRDMMLATIETALGRPRAALCLLDRYRGSGLAIPLEVVRARAYMALGEFRKAQDCVRHVITGEASLVGRYLLVEALICDAEIEQVQGNAARAVEVLVRATEIADDDIRLPFLRTTDVFAALLNRHPMLAGNWPSATAEPRADAPGVIRTTRLSPLPETLTDRERAVLRLLTTSMSAGEIAEELHVSLNTVKTHLAAIYRKLGARRRHEAVVRAREYEML